MQRFLSLPIRFHMFLLVLLLTLPAVGVIIHEGLERRNELYKEAANDSARLVYTMSTEIMIQIRSAEQVADTLAQLPAMKKLDPKVINPLLLNLTKKYPCYANIVVTDKDGIVRASGIPLSENVSLADRKSFKEAKATGLFSAGEYVIGKVFNNPLISFSFPLKDTQGHFSGIIGIGIDLSSIKHHLFEKNSFPEGAEIVLLDHKGIFLYRTFELEKFRGTPVRKDLLKTMEDGPEEKTYEFITNDGMRRLSSYRKLRLRQDLPPFIYVRGGFPLDSVTAMANQAMLKNLALLFPFCVLSICIAWYISKRGVLDRIHALQDASQRLAAGDFTIQVAKHVSGSELGDLAKTFDSMAESLAEREQSLKDNVELIRNINHRLSFQIQHMPLAYIVWDEQCRVLEWNPTAERMFGWSADEAKGRHPKDLIVPSQYKSAVVALWSDLMMGKEVAFTESRNLRKDGQTIICQWHNAPLRNQQGQVVGALSMASDITFRKEAELALKESEAKFRSLFESMQEGVIISRVIYDADDEPVDLKFIEFNKACESILKKSRIDLAGQKFGSLFPGISSAYFEKLLKVAKNQETQHFEYHIESTDSYFEVYAFCPSPGGLAIILRDVTEIKKMHDERIRNDKLESLGILAGGIAHDFNNYLAGVMGNISFARKLLDSSHKSFKLLKDAETATQRAAGLARQLLTFAKGGVPVKSVISVKQLLEDSAALVLRGTNIKVNFMMPQHLHNVEADEGQLTQAFHNVIINAVQAMPGGGILTITAEDMQMMGSETSNQGGDFVKISFTDEGCGISDEDLEHIFDPYFTTKPDGNGLGLASTYSIISRHGGHISVQSSVGKGTTFEMFLPVCDEAIGTPIETQVVKDIAPETKFKLLFMDDEEDLRVLLTDILEHAGYFVETCCNGAEAIEMFRHALDTGHPFDAVIMDLTIPGAMGGKETVPFLLEMDPKACLIVSSGYSNDPVLSDYQSYGFCAAITKPFMIEELYSTIEKTLDGKKRQ